MGSGARVFIHVRERGGPRLRSDERGLSTLEKIGIAALLLAIISFIPVVRGWIGDAYDAIFKQVDEATGETLLEGCMAHLGRPFMVAFLLYLLPWSFFVGAALMSACGATAHAMAPVFAEASHGKIVFGVLHSVLGVVLNMCRYTGEDYGYY